ncbi:DUF6207 family protein [Streptomyces sp. NPDC127119]|uniref:DUF6207 family protein n=1 Tax=Streptomyces sp. NPDC127119 TaxID=3345370 RepID=UPI003635036B
MVDIAASDEATAFAVQRLLTVHRAIAPAERTRRDLGELGVRLRCFPQPPSTSGSLST